MECPLKGPLRLKLPGDYLQGWGIILQVAVHTLNQIPCGTCPQEEEYMGLRNEVEVGVSALVVTISDYWGLMFSLPVTLDSMGFEN